MIDRDARGRKPRFHVVLIKPSKYDDDGYVISWWHALVGSNSLACMYALTERVVHDGILGAGVEVVIHFLDETVCRIPVRRLARTIQSAGDRAIICMVGVQSNQYPRAVDLSLQFMRHGLKAMIGGFHVSGSLAMLPKIPEEIQAAIDAGITIVAGEVEARWGDLLRAAHDGTLQPCYKFLDDVPSLEGVAPPFAPKVALRRFMPPNQTSFDAGRGCPFKCSFCTIINVQGNRMRGRTADDVEALIRRNVAQGVNRFFITDDNFARHREWEAIIDRIIDLREREGLHLSLMLQTDTLAHRIPRFIEKTARAGCKRVFIGIESVNPENLAATDKRHNRIAEYRTMLQQWRAHGVTTFAGYIIGFPADTYESIMRDVEYLKRELPLDFAEFFMMTPLPGSRDHQQYWLQGMPMEPDMNLYDSMHVCMDHPRMSRDELVRALHDAWRSFYSREHVLTVLKRHKDKRRENIAYKLIWFRSSVFIENLHPFMGGVFRFKGRMRRSPRFPVESIPAYYWRRTRDIARWSVQMLAQLIEMRRLYVRAKRDPEYVDVAITPEPLPPRTPLEPGPPRLSAVAAAVSQPS